MSNNAISFIRSQFTLAHDWLGATMNGVTNETAQWTPDGKPNPIGAQLGHVVTTEDFLMSAVRSQPPLMATEYAGKTGLSELPPPGDWSMWAHSVKVDVATANAYAKVVWANSDAILAAMSDDDLNKPFDLSGIGMGMQSVATVINLIVLNNYVHMGEISALKGLQGLRGYPA